MAKYMNQYLTCRISVETRERIQRRIDAARKPGRRVLTIEEIIVQALDTLDRVERKTRAQSREETREMLRVIGS